MLIECYKINVTMSLQVYEHVYETVDINSTPEVRANATAKVTKAAINFFTSEHKVKILLFSGRNYELISGCIKCSIFAKVNQRLLFACRQLWQRLQPVKDTHILVSWSCQRLKKAWVLT